MQSFMWHKLVLARKNYKVVRKLTISQNVNELLNYGLDNGLIQKADIDFVANQLLDLLQIKTFNFSKVNIDKNIDEILVSILDYATEIGLIEGDATFERDLFDTRVMGSLMPRSSEVNARFAALYSTNPKEATDYFYHLSQASNYIRTQRIKKDRRWKVKTAYGELDITINLSKPEKDPRTIALAKELPASGYPLCVLCKENVGFAGHINHPARQNHRIIPVELVNESWYLQYSPYVYYNEHCIVLKGEHVPMVIEHATFARMFDFVKKFKHYFVGANADLSIVGGSILSHDHFQGGAYTFAMNHAPTLRKFQIKDFSDVEIGLLKWPLTTLRLKGESPKFLTKLADRILKSWRNYTDEALGIFAQTFGQPHNTITPIARYNNGIYELDLVLRNNRTSDEHPDGIFHPHQQYHHLKKENIGLIEVMGLAILPSRLLFEIKIIKQALTSSNVQLLEEDDLKKHKDWYFELESYAKNLHEEQVEALIKESIGLKFAEILACCGVFKPDEAGLAGIERFMKTI